MTNEEAIIDIRENIQPIVGGKSLDIAISALEKQIPKKPYLDNDNGIYQKEYCPTCHRSLFPNDHHCKCGQALDCGDTE